MNLSKREKILISILFVVIVFAVYLFYLVLPLLESYNNNKEVYLTQNDELNRLILLRDSSELDKIEEKINKQTEDIGLIVPHNFKQPLVYLTLLEDIDNSNVMLKNLTFSSPQYLDDNEITQEEQMVIFSINLSVEGNYLNIKKLYNLIIEDERKFDIQSFNIDRNTSAGSVGVSLSLNTYSFIKKGQNLSDFIEYDFTKDNYGKNNPYN